MKRREKTTKPLQLRVIRFVSCFLIAGAVAFAIWEIGWRYWDATDIWKICQNYNYTYLLQALIAVQGALFLTLGLSGGGSKLSPSEIRAVDATLAKFDEIAKEREQKIIENLQDLENRFNDLTITLKLAPNKKEEAKPANGKS